MIFCASAFCADAYINKLLVTNSDYEIVVYFDLGGAFTRDMEKAIENGIPTTFTFIIKLNEVNNMWFDSSLQKLKIYRTIKYDSLKKQYVVTQTIDGFAEEELKMTTEFSEAKKAMNEFDKISIINTDKLKKMSTYELQVKAELAKVKLPFYLEYILLFVSIWDFETDWYTEKFTF